MKHAKVKKLPKQTKTSTVTKTKTKTTATVDDSKPKSRAMACVVTGIEKRVSKAGMAKGIKKFGDLTAFIEHYVSNEAKRLLKQRVSPEEVQKQLRPSNLKPFTIDKQVLARLKLLKKPRNKKLTIEEVQQISVKWVPKEPRSYPSKEAYILDNTKNGSCIAPQLFLDSDRCCDHCQYTKHCLSTAKTFSKRYKSNQ
jgi:hypothetical protein